MRIDSIAPKGRIHMSKSKTFKVGRDSESGRFKPVDEAERDRKGSTVERVPKRGFGDTSDDKPPRK